jgi:hypothetical protein
MAMLAKQGLGQCGTRERKEGKIKVTVAINRNGQSHACLRPRGCSNFKQVLRQQGL